MIVERKGYQTSYGLLRILACIFVIIHHFDAVVVDASSQKGMAVVDNLTMVNNGLFFMLSGKFALEYFDGNVTAYYSKRFVKIVVPYLVINCAINMMHGYTITEYISRLGHGYEKIYLPGVNASLYGLCITRICMCAAVYVLVCWSNSRIIQDKNIQKIVKRLANLTYYVYLVHGLVQEPYAALHSYIISKNPYIRLAAGSLEIIAVSFVLAYLYERITRMIYKIAGEKRIWGRLKSN